MATHTGHKPKSLGSELSHRTGLGQIINRAGTIGTLILVHKPDMREGNRDAGQFVGLIVKRVANSWGLACA